MVNDRVLILDDKESEGLLYGAECGFIHGFVRFNMPLEDSDAVTLRQGHSKILDEIPVGEIVSFHQLWTEAGYCLAEEVRFTLVSRAADGEVRLEKCE